MPVRVSKLTEGFLEVDAGTTPLVHSNCLFLNTYSAIELSKTCVALTGVIQRR